MCPILSPNVIDFNNSLSSSKLGTVNYLLIQPYRSGLVIAIPYWLLSSILIILDENLFSWPSTVLKSTFSFLGSFKRTSVSNAILEFMKLYPSTHNSFFKNSNDFCKCWQNNFTFAFQSMNTPRKALALLYFLGLYLNSSWRCAGLLSNI